MKKRVMMQAFEWYLADDGQYYQQLIQRLNEFKEVGINALWIPPVFKATGTNDVGYGIYDLFDLGEFDQKGSIRTKYGTKEELLELIKRAHELGIHVYADTVLNHKAGADDKERFMAVEVNPENRQETIGEPHEIEAWTQFNFDNRNNKYSNFKWNFHHFTGVDYDELTQTSAIFRVLGENKDWSESVSSEKGNYDYLMFSDVNLEHPDVQAELFHWVEWFVQETKVDGLRLDALKHMDTQFVADFVAHCRQSFGDQFYLVGEYWSGSSDEKLQYLDEVNYLTDLFDVGLHFNFYEAALQNENYDLRTIFNNTLVRDNPTLAVTFVDNHDSQMGQSLESWVGEWFKPLAYTLILMRVEGYPCVFWGDYVGIEGEHSFASQKEWLDRILKARMMFGHGDQEDYFNDANVIGWVRMGTDENPGGCASLINNSPDISSIRMYVGSDQIGKSYYDLLLGIEDVVLIDDEGFGEFKVNGRSASIWVSQESTEVFS